MSTPPWGNFSEAELLRKCYIHSGGSTRTHTQQITAALVRYIPSRYLHKGHRSAFAARPRRRRKIPRKKGFLPSCALRQCRTRHKFDRNALSGQNCSQNSFRGLNTQVMSSLSPKRDYGPETVKKPPIFAVTGDHSK